jgi:S1-C subfamily serine protease
MLLAIGYSTERRSRYVNFSEEQAMRHQLLWVAAAVALAAGLHLDLHQALAQEAGASTDASADTDQATQPTETESSDAAGQADAQSSKTQSDTGANTSDAAASGQSSSQTGPALPPPDGSAQQQDSATPSQDEGAQAQQTQPPATTSQNQPEDQAQPSNQDQSVQGRAGAETDASRHGQTELRGDARNREFRDRDFRGRGSRDVNIGIHFGVPTGRGLVIDMIDRDSVFFDSGLRRGDVLISLHGRPIRSQAEFVHWVHTHPGERIPVVVLRDGRQETVYITYDEAMVPQDHQVYRPAEPQVAGRQPFLGVMFDIQVPDAAVVRDVTPGSPAEHAGLRPGDMIVALNGQRVSSHQHAIQVIRMMRPGDQLMIDFSRRVTDQTQALLADRPGEPVRTATAPDVRYEQEVAPMPEPIYQDRPGNVPPNEIDRERRIRPPFRDRPLLPRLRN